MTARSTPPARDGASNGPAAQVSDLDRRREKMQTAKAAVADATAALAAIDSRLAANVGQRDAQKAALVMAQKSVAGLKRDIEAVTAERTTLQDTRKDARRAVEKAQQHADTAEGKYDAAMLADLLRREKDHDLSAHAENPGAGGAGRAGRADLAWQPAPEPDNDTAHQNPPAPSSATTTRPRTDVGD